MVYTEKPGAVTMLRPVYFSALFAQKISPEQPDISTAGMTCTGETSITGPM